MTAASLLHSNHWRSLTWHCHNSQSIFIYFLNQIQAVLCLEEVGVATSPLLLSTFSNRRLPKKKYKMFCKWLLCRRASGRHCTWRTAAITVLSATTTMIYSLHRYWFRYEVCIYYIVPYCKKMYGTINLIPTLHP